MAADTDATPSSPNPVADNPAVDLNVNAPRVRELRWNEYEREGDIDQWDAEAGKFHVYYGVELHHDGYRTFWDGEAFGPFDTLEAAKSAAQADYERRVLACLEPGQGWRDIASAPDRALIVAKAINITLPSGQKYTSDPWVVWRQDGSYARWPHDFRPTHFIPLPPAAEESR